MFAFNQRDTWDQIKPNWISFVAELSAALHAQNKLLSVTVPPVWNNGNSGYTVYAQAEIAQLEQLLAFEECKIDCSDLRQFAQQDVQLLNPFLWGQ